MRHPASGWVRNEITGNRWIWGSLFLCSALLVVPAYVAPLTHLLALVPPTLDMWLVILGASLAPMVVAQLSMPVLRRLHRGAAR